MRISILILAFLLLIAVTNNRASLALTPEPSMAPVVREPEKTGQKQSVQELDRVERQKQLPAITAVFARHTSESQACRLAYLCYETTIGTPFKPIDLAELALAETGGHALSGKAVSSEGAMGVWQLMPARARSHGFKAAEMSRDEKCATAAVRELAVKLKVAGGDLAKAKRLYCGAGKQARLYGIKTSKYRKQIMSLMEKEQKPVYGI